MSGNGRRPRGARGFCGEAFPWPLIRELGEGAEVTACYLLQEKRSGVTKAGKPYLILALADCTGSIDAKVWDDAERWDGVCGEARVIGVQARVKRYDGKLELHVHLLEPLEPEDADWERLLPAAPRPLAEMQRELDALLATIAEPQLRALLQRCVGAGTELGRAFRRHPAAKKHHHAYLGGLLEHSLSVATACDFLARHYVAQQLPLDRDLLLTGALLHDIGKLVELDEIPGAGYTTAGKLLGHIVLGIQMVARQAGQLPGFPEEKLLQLQHLIASHQGRPEWDSPRVPQMVEAMILHYADDLDAKLNQVRTLLSPVADGEWSGYDRGLARAFFRPAAQLPPNPVLEPVPPAEAVEVVFDLFRS